MAKTRVSSSGYDLATLKRRVQSIARKFSGRVGVAARNLTTGEEIFIREHEQFPTLSTIRVPMMTELFFQAHEGRVRMEEKITIKKSDHRGGTGPLQFLSAPLEMTLRDVLIFTIKESDNTASCLEVQRVGRDNINKRMRSLGLNEVDLRSDLSATMFEDIRKMDISSVAVASPANLMELVSGMARGTLVSKKASAEMLDILHRCNEPEFMGRYLPVDQLPEDTGATVEAKLSNKTGSFMDGRTDVGLVETEHVKFVLAVMTADSKDPGFLLFQHEGARMIGWIARVIYDAWVHGKAFEGRVKLFGPD